MPLPPTNGSCYWQPQFVDARDATVCHTTDGGRHWTAISPIMVR